MVKKGRVFCSLNISRESESGQDFNDLDVIVRGLQEIPKTKRGFRF